MEVNSTLVLTTILVGTILLVYILKKNRNKSPPGPWSLPVIGYLPFLNPSNPAISMNSLLDRYGPIVSVRLGSWNGVILGDVDLIKKAFNKSEFAFRPNLYFFEIFTRGKYGLVASNGHLWHEQRRFALRHLRDLGMGKSTIENHIREEALAMVDILRKTQGKPTDLSFSLNIAIVNIVWAIVAGQRLKYDDPMFLGLMAAINRNIKLLSDVGIFGFMPWLAKIMPKKWHSVDLIYESRDEFTRYAKEVIDQHTSTFNSNDIRDFIDYFLDEMKKQESNPDSTFTELQLLIAIGDLFVAGGETTGTTLRWAVLLLSYYPEIQAKLQKEIDDIVGRDRLPTFDDRANMPYTDAVIHEVQRFADIVPMGIFRATGTDIEFEGYHIPKDTMVFGLLNRCHRDPKYWEKPDEFYPEHFLDSDGNLKKNVESFLPFSTGKRSCIGEALARLELFFFITYFFQTFSFTLVDDPKPSLKPNPEAGFVLSPLPYKVIIQPRN